MPTSKGREWEKGRKEMGREEGNGRRGREGEGRLASNTFLGPEQAVDNSGYNMEQIEIVKEKISDVLRDKFDGAKIRSRAK